MKQLIKLFFNRNGSKLSEINQKHTQVVGCSMAKSRQEANITFSS